MTAALGKIQVTKIFITTLSLLKWFPLLVNFFTFVSEHIQLTASDYHTNLSIILDIF